MKRLMLTLLLCVMTLTVSCRAAESQSAKLIWPAYIAATNGAFAVCQFDPERKVLLRWQGVYISSNQLPQAGPNRDILIFDSGTRPPVDRSEPGMIRTPKGFYHHYGEIPYPVEDIDPPLEYCLDPEGSLLVGFRMRGTFYAIMVEKSPSLKQIPVTKHWSKVTEVSLPAHRQSDLENVKGKLLKNVERESLLGPAYIEATNGLFSVCAYDRSDSVLLRYKGLYISRTNLPPVSIIRRPALIYAMGERPPIDAQATDPWRPTLESMCIYGEIPYPVKDIDPKLGLCKTWEGGTFIGVRVRSRFHAITNVGEVARTDLPGVSVYESSGRDLHVVPATLPKHREEEINALIRSLRTGQ